MINIEWNEADRAYLRNVFSQPSGAKFLLKVKASIPRVTAVNMEEVGIEALKKQGAEDLYDAIEGLAQSDPELQEGKDFVNLSAEGC